MTRHGTNRFFAFVISTIGTALISVIAAWLATSLVFTPTMLQPGSTKWDQSSSRPLYRLSPIPAGADWTA
jgi:hypothetical protein